MKHVFFLLSLILCCANSSFGTHIVGGEIYYRCTNSSTNTFEINLTLYRDCLGGQAPYDPNLTLFFFESATGNVVLTQSVSVPPFTPNIIPASIANCLNSLPPLCVEKGEYLTTVQLPPLAGGYDVGWTRCCRNQNITNLMQPLNEGITFSVHIPDPGTLGCNTLPEFKELPPTFACRNEWFLMDHGAVDADGDSLVFELCDPFTGINFQGLGAGNPNFGGNQPIVDPLTNLMGPPPYNQVLFGNGYDYTNPFGSGMLQLDSHTGILTARPTQTGNFVVCVGVKEYRNGQLLGEYRRDMQIFVVNCTATADNINLTSDLSALTHSNDTIYLSDKDSICFPVSATANPLDVAAIELYPLNFPSEASLTAGSPANPANGQVCWQPTCNNYDGQTIRLIIGARSTLDCGSIMDVFDTVYVNLTATGNLIGGNLPVVDFQVSNGFPQQNWIQLTNQSQYGERYQWDFGDGRISNRPAPDHTFQFGNDFTIQLTVWNACGMAQKSVDFSVVPTSLDPSLTHTLTVYPNPVSDRLMIQVEHEYIGSWALLSMEGKVIKSGYQASRALYLPMQELANGMCLLRVGKGENALYRKIIVER
ncbi:MAG: PKD domain-containing protein [Bacteroidota bacterium]